MDIIARGMAASAENKAELAVNMVADFPSGLQYKGKVNDISDLPASADVGDAYTVVNEDNKEYAWDGSEWSIIGPDLDAYALKSELSKVATTGSYTDLTDKPTIPTVDQTYDGTSANAQSGVAVAEAVTALTGSTAPTTSTVGYVGQHYIDTSTTPNKVYECTAKTAQGTTPETYEYTWTLLAPVQSVSVVGTALTPDASGNVDIPTAGSSAGVVKIDTSYGVGMYGGKLRIQQTNDIDLRNRSGYKPITAYTNDTAVKYAMTDGRGAAWTDAEKTGSWKRQSIVKVIGRTATPATSTTPEIITAMDAVAVPGAQYYFLNKQSTVSFTLPDNASVGQQITVSWYNGSTPATLTISEGTTLILDFTYVPSANTRSELNCLWDGSYWSVLGVEQGVPENAG